MLLNLRGSEKCHITGRYCRWWGILYSSAGTAAWLFNKVKYKELKLGFIRRAPNHSTAELPLLIAPMSSPLLVIPMLCAVLLVFLKKVINTVNRQQF